MLSYFDLRKGTRFIFNGQPYEVLNFQQIYKAQDMVVARTRIKNLISDAVIEKTFHQGENFEEAEISKIRTRFIYSHRDKFVFSKIDNPSFRFELKKEQISGVDFLKRNLEVEALEWEGKIINVSLPIKIQLKVIEAPPGLKGERAQPGTKQVTVESGAKINTPLFIKEGETIEVNTETGEYTRRIN